MASVPTKEMKLTEARAHFSELVAEVHRNGTRVDITKSGIPVATIISPSDSERLRRLDEEREKDFAVLDEFSRQLAAIPDEEFERELAKALKEVREDMERERLASEAG
jgi:prevent-host-death family protein